MTYLVWQKWNMFSISWYTGSIYGTGLFKYGDRYSSSWWYYDKEMFKASMKFEISCYSFLYLFYHYFSLFLANTFYYYHFHDSEYYKVVILFEYISFIKCKYMFHFLLIVVKIKLPILYCEMYIYILEDSKKQMKSNCSNVR